MIDYIIVMVLLIIVIAFFGVIVIMLTNLFMRLINHFQNAISVRNAKNVLSKYTYSGIHLNIKPKYNLHANIVSISSDDEYVSINLSNGIGKYMRGELSIEFYPLYEFMARDTLLKIMYEWAQEVMKREIDNNELIIKH